MLSIHWCILCKKRSMSFFILPYARPKSTHQISPRVILYRLPHSAHRRMSRGKLFFLRNFVIYGVNTVNFRLIYIRVILIGTFFCKQQLNFFYIHYTVLLLYYTYWKCLNRRLSPETQSATLKFELWEAGMTLEYVLVVVAIISCIASVIGTVYAALTYHKKK